MTVYDISQEVFSCNVFPGDPAPEKIPMTRMSEGAVYNLTSLSMCAHNGTHIDAPFHFIRDGKTVDQMPPEVFVGPAYVAECTGILSAADAIKILEKAKAADPSCARRILIKGPATVSLEAAEIFAGEKLLLIGNESQTVGPENAPMAVHLMLLGADVALLEGIRLGHIPEGNYLLSAAPLNLAGIDGAPCRAVLIDL